MARPGANRLAREVDSGDLMSLNDHCCFPSHPHWRQPANLCLLLPFGYNRFQRRRSIQGLPPKSLKSAANRSKEFQSVMEVVPNLTDSRLEYRAGPHQATVIARWSVDPADAKAFDVLVVLIENRERVIAKEELMELVWPDQFVEEANLTVQVSALRRALGEKKDERRFIVTVPGRRLPVRRRCAKRRCQTR